MADIARPYIFFVDDELKVCEIVSAILEESGFEVSHFTRPADCLEQLRSQNCDLLITDLKMPEMDGIELLAGAKRIVPWVPVLVITGYGDVPTAVAAIKGGAVDFIEKPLGRERLLRSVTSILQRSPPTGSYVGKTLTSSEMRVLELIINGKTNREIAVSLNRSLRTIELHRHRLMQKLGVDNVVDLLRRVAAMGSVELPARQEPDESNEQ